MYDQSFSDIQLAALLRRPDFRKYHAVLSSATKDALISDAVATAAHSFHVRSSLTAIPVAGRRVFRFDQFADDLVARKISRNLRSVVDPEILSRDAIVRSLSLLLEEGIPFRLYRLDV